MFMNDENDRPEVELPPDDESEVKPWPSPPPSAGFRESLAIAENTFKRAWPVWLVTLVTLANGLLSILQTIFLRFPQHPRLYGSVSPFGLFHWSRLLTVVLGFILIYLSLYLFQHRRAAWWVAVGATALSLAVHATTRGNWYTAPAPLVTLALLLIFQKRFTVRSEMRNIAQGFVLLVGSIVIAVGYGTLGFWYLDRRDFGITFSFPGSMWRALRELFLVGNSDLVYHTRYAHWFLQSLDILGIVAILFAVYSLFRPVVYRLGVLPHEHDEARDILNEFGKSSYDFFKTWADKSYFFSKSRRSFISYRTVSGVAFCLGDPVGPDDEIEETISSFLDYCYQNGWLAAFLVPESPDLYKKFGLSLLKVGEEAVVDLEKFTKRTAEKKYFRYVRRKFGGEGFTVVRSVPPHDLKLYNEAEEISKEWLALPNHREFGFLQGQFDRNYVASSTMFLLRDAPGRLIAFINQVKSYRPGEATFDMMRHRPGTHWGTMDYLFTELMFQLIAENYRTFNMGLAPFARMSQVPGGTPMEEPVTRLMNYLDFFVHSKGISNYKLKFEPAWENRYLAYQGGPIGLARVGISINRVL
jgi:phosphatidylglycerol lysyltransferase